LNLVREAPKRGKDVFPPKEILHEQYIGEHRAYGDDVCVSPGIGRDAENDGQDYAEDRKWIDPKKAPDVKT
jgi:hypothetical protein